MLAEVGIAVAKAGPVRHRQFQSLAEECKRWWLGQCPSSAQLPTHRLSYDSAPRWPHHRKIHPVKVACAIYRDNKTLAASLETGGSDHANPTTTKLSSPTCPSFLSLLSLLPGRYFLFHWSRLPKLLLLLLYWEMKDRERLLFFKDQPATNLPPASSLDHPN